jgi:hypothetical protein
VRTMSTTAGTVFVRAQSRCSSHANDTQLIGCAPARTMRSSPARWVSTDVPLAGNPLTSFTDDVAATKRAIAAQDGPTVLVGHSYGAW